MHTGLVISAFPPAGKQGTSQMKDHLGLNLGKKREHTREG
jgi:hypothetical protein